MYCDEICVITAVCLLTPLFFHFHFHQCVPLSRRTFKVRQQPLKLIHSKNAGQRVQIDLIHMPECNGHNYILGCVDHLSHFAHVKVLKGISSKEVGAALIRIISHSVIPDIIQSNN